MASHWSARSCTVEAESPALPPAPPVHAIMDQVNLAFVPDVLVIPVHSTVQFPNSDAVSHQVYSFSSARQFQLPLYRGKPYPPVTFDQPGIVTLGCNIHDNMLAYIVVTAAPFFGRTDAATENGARTDVPARQIPGARLASAAQRAAGRRASRRRSARSDDDVEFRLARKPHARPTHRPAALMGLLNRKSAALAAAVLAAPRRHARHTPATGNSRSICAP